MGFAAGFSVGWNAVDSALKRAEEAKRLEKEKAEKEAKEIKEYNNNLASDVQKLIFDGQKSKKTYLSEKNKIMTNDKYKDKKSRMRAINNLNRTFSQGMQIYDNAIKRKTESMTDINIVKSFIPDIQMVKEGLDFTTYGSIEIDGKEITLPTQIIEQVDSNPNNYGIGKDNNLYLKDANGQLLTDKLVATHTSFEGSSIKVPTERELMFDRFSELPENEKSKYNNDFNEFVTSEKLRLETKYKENNNIDDETKVENLAEDIKMYKKELETAKTYGESKKIFELNNKINKAKNDINKTISNNKNIKDPFKQTEASINEFIAKTNSQSKKGIEPSPIEAKSVLEKQMDGNVDFDNPNHVKKIQQTISYAGKEELMSLFSKKYNEARDLEKDQQSYVDGKFLPLLKAEKDGGSSHATNAYYKNKVYDIVAYMATQDDPSNKDVSLYGKVKEVANQMKSGTGNKKMIDLIYQQDIEPVIQGFKGKSREFYAEDWDVAKKQYSQMEGVGSIQELWSGQFADLGEALSSLQDYIDDNNDGLAAWFADVTSTDKSNIEKFLTNTFPKLQLAYKLENPDEPLLNPIDLVKMINRDYESNTFTDFGSPKKNSKLYDLITLADSIKY